MMMTTYPWGDNRRFNSYKRFLKDQFGIRVQKLTLDAGFTCPNRDGTIGFGGCSYCLNEAFNPSYCISSKSIEQQLKEGIEFHLNRYRRAEGYLAYFQAFSNTHASLLEMKETYRLAIENPLIKGIVIGTRPDCIDEEKLDYFADLQKKIFVSIEYGIESIHNVTLEKINRGHTFEQSLSALQMSFERNIHTCIHLIFGFSNETPELWLKDINIINQLPLKSIKFHQLQIIKNTPLEKEYLHNPNEFYPFNMEKYIDFIVKYTEKLNPQFIIERFAGEVPPKFLAVNNWGNIRYDSVLSKIEKKLEIDNTYQGRLFQQRIDKTK